MGLFWGSYKATRGVFRALDSIGNSVCHDINVNFNNSHGCTVDHRSDATRSRCSTCNPRTSFSTSTSDADLREQGAQHAAQIVARLEAEDRQRVADVETRRHEISADVIDRFITDFAELTGQPIEIVANVKLRSSAALVIAHLDVASESGIGQESADILGEKDVNLGLLARAYLARLGTLAGTLPDPVWPTARDTHLANQAAALADVHEEIKRYNEAQVAALRTRRELLATVRGFAGHQVPATTTTDMTDVYAQLAKDEAAYRRDM